MFWDISDYCRHKPSEEEIGIYLSRREYSLLATLKQGVVRLELQFMKKEFPYLRALISETQMQEQTQEVRIPDGMPDVGRVICGWGQLLVRGKQWRPGSIGVNGGVMAWVLYVPENGDRPQPVEAWIPFQMKWDMEEIVQNGTITVTPFLRAVDARSVSARKLLIRAEIGLSVQARCTDHIHTYMPQEAPEDICVKTMIYPVKLLSEAGEKAFSIQDKIDVSSLPVPVETIIYYSLLPGATEKKFLADKLLFRGSALMHLLYWGTDERLHVADMEFPFSQYCELENAYDEEAECGIVFAVTDMELQKDQEGNLQLKSGLLAQYNIQSNTEVQVVEDAYSTQKETQLQTESVKIPAVLDTVMQTATVRQSEGISGMEILDAVFYPGVPGLYRDDEGITAALSGQISMLTIDMTGELQCVQNEWEQEQSIPADSQVGVEMQILPAGPWITTADGGFGTDVQMQISLLNEKEIQILTGITMGEEKQTDPDGPSLILCRPGERSLWDIAKSTGSTVDAIKKANELNGEPRENKILLVPVIA